MLEFHEMYLTCYKRESGEPMVALEAQRLVEVSEKERAEEYARDSDYGLKFLSFYMTGHEFVGLMTGAVSTANDLGHNVRKLGEVATFYDLEFSRESRGVMRVPFVNIEIPHYVAKVLHRAVRLAWRRCEAGGERVRVELPWNTRAKWHARYGQGKGRVKLDVNDQEFFDKCRADGGLTFARCLNHLHDIALNQTYRASDEAKVMLSKDWDGFYFRVLTPTGGCMLNGGVINHGRDGKQDWSMHT